MTSDASLVVCRAQARCSSWTSPAAAACRHRRRRPCSAAASNGSDVAGSGSEQPPASSGSGLSSFQRSPWELMGRVVREERVALQVKKWTRDQKTSHAVSEADSLLLCTASWPLRLTASA